METTLVVSFEAAGVHRWDVAHVGAPPPRGKEYLTSDHRHLFKCRAWFKVAKARDIELIKVKEILLSELRMIFSQGPSPLSCEEIAGLLFECAAANGVTLDKVEVLEDGENGAILERRA